MRALARFDAGFDGDRRHLPDLRFGDAMRLFGMTARALRLYEERGLVEARRDPMNRRYYDALARKKLARIASLRTAGLSLNEIREILAADDVGERGLDCALAKLNRRREALRRDLAAVERVIADLRRDLPEDLQSRRRSV